MLEKIKDQFEYTKQEDGVRIDRVILEERSIEIPENIEDSPVTVIGERALAEKKEVMKVVLPNTIKRIEKYAFSECRGLVSISLPESVTSIGSHCFYNCRRLEEVIFSSEVADISDGAFKNCRGLKAFTFLLGEKNVAFKKVIPDISGNITVKLEKQGKIRAKIFFPKENVSMSDFSTRLYMDVRYGVGNYYRQAIGNDGLEYETYDSLFQRAKNELTEEMLIQIAMNRLFYPEGLVEEYKKAYESYVKEKHQEICSFLIEEKDMENFSRLLEQVTFTKEMIERMLAIAYEENQTEAAGYLLEYKHKHWSKQKMEFEL